MKKEENAKDPLLKALQEIEDANPDIKSKERGDGIVDIMTFCNSPKYLDLPGNNLELWLSQKVILKTFYMGTRGNENTKLNEEEWKWLYGQAEEEKRDGIIFEKNIQDVIDKILKIEKEPFTFKELHLVLGRRGSKTSMASIISAYEAYKLLVIGGGDAHKFYNLPYDDEIAIINVALSQRQAGLLFNYMKSRLRNSPFFKGRIANETTSEIRLYTDRDLEKVEKGKKEGVNISVSGSIAILCGHSNPDSMAGRNAILILFDELAFYDEGGKINGKYFYNRLKPALSQFNRFGDGRLVEISSPNVKNGIFYEIFCNAKKYDHILSFQLPTWDSNFSMDYNHLDMVQERETNKDAFLVEYGAQWATSGIYGNYFPEQLIERCIKIDGVPHDRPLPRLNYFLHVDPAKKGARYVAVLVAKEYYLNNMGKRRVRVHLANTWIWKAQAGIGLLFDEIDKEIVKICSLYHPMVVSYDQYNSEHSLQLLRSHGINTKETSFNRAFKNKIYQNLKSMMSYQPDPELVLYPDTELISELQALKYRPTPRGIAFVTDKHGDVKTDDLVDCLAGATSMASDGVRMALPHSVTVRTGWR